MKEGHRAGHGIELERIRELHVDRIPIARVGTGESVRERVGRVDGNRPVDVAGKLIECVHRPVGGRKRTCSKQHRQVRSCREPEYADFLRIKAALLRIVADETDGTLPIDQRTLINRQVLRSWRAIREAHTNKP